MGSWDINPALVSSIIKSVQTTVEGDLATALKDIGTQGNTAITSCTQPSPLSSSGDAPLVASAIGTFFENRKSQLEGLGTRVSAAVKGTVSAVTSYVNQDESGALEYQRSAAGTA
ncbi:DUF6507 family protein [Actinomyces sp. zg296]|uniref:DUF6507 family protein n=1 Tax=Actinomyces sp. zg296 TaxID=2609289 RepID=UPI001359A120|nr:DUF6507 family protein [Actinomyces sp. zg296]